MPLQRYYRRKSRSVVDRWSRDEHSTMLGQLSNVIELLGIPCRLPEYASPIWPQLLLKMERHRSCASSAPAATFDESHFGRWLTLRCLVGGVSAAVSKTAAAPIERVKLLIQNQVSNKLGESRQHPGRPMSVQSIIVSLDDFGNFRFP